MRAVVQRVTEASVSVEGAVIGTIGTGLLVLVGVTHHDSAETAVSLARKVAGLRILRDGARDDSSALDVKAPVLVISQFTLYADTSRGRRPSWGQAAPGEVAEPLVATFAAELAALGLEVQTGSFGAMMRVASENDGPMTILLDIP
jgi:D-tyrosyl-tRNA(Tyr) deacylase